MHLLGLEVRLADDVGPGFGDLGVVPDMVPVVACNSEEGPGFCLELRKVPLLDSVHVGLGRPDAVLVQCVAEVEDLVCEEGAFLRGQPQPGVPVGGQRRPDVLDMSLDILAVDNAVIEKAYGHLRRNLSQDHLDQAAVGSRPIADAKAHPLLLERPEGRAEGGLLPVRLLNLHDVESPLHVEAGEDPAPSEAGYVISYSRHRKTVFLCDVIETAPVDAPSDLAALFLGGDQVERPW